MADVYLPPKALSLLYCPHADQPDHFVHTCVKFTCLVRRCLSVDHPTHISTRSWFTARHVTPTNAGTMRNPTWHWLHLHDGQ